MRTALVALLAAASALAGLPVRLKGPAEDCCVTEACRCGGAKSPVADCCSADGQEGRRAPVLAPICGCDAHGAAVVLLLGDSLRSAPGLVSSQVPAEETDALEPGFALVVSRRPSPEPPPPRRS